MQDTKRTMKSFILREGDGGNLLLIYYRISESHFLGRLIRISGVSKERGV